MSLMSSHNTFSAKMLYNAELIIINPLDFLQYGTCILIKGRWEGEASFSEFKSQQKDKKKVKYKESVGQ